MKKSLQKRPVSQIFTIHKIYFTMYELTFEQHEHFCFSVLFRNVPITQFLVEVLGNCWYRVPIKHIGNALSKKERASDFSHIHIDMHMHACMCCVVLTNPPNQYQMQFVIQ